jgi:hypothetical protein
MNRLANENAGISPICTRLIFLTTNSILKIITPHFPENQIKNKEMPNNLLNETCFPHYHGIVSSSSPVF